MSTERDLKSRFRLVERIICLRNIDIINKQKCTEVKWCVRHSPIIKNNEEKVLMKCWAKKRFET